MADDVDDLLRHAMKTLDAQVPEGYFDALPSKIQSTLARSEDSSMQSTGTTESNRDASTGVPPMTKEAREEDSGLHDIRSLASSTKARLSSRRSTQNPVMSEDDILASSSAGWKAVALPEPAKMISLPELADLPSAKEIKDKDKAAKKAKAAEIKAELKSGSSGSLPSISSSASSGSLPSIPAAAVATEAAAPAASVSAIPTIGSRIAAKKKPSTGSGNGKTIAFVGMGLAAAAAVSLFFVMNNKKDSSAAKQEQTVAAGAPAAEYKSTTKMLPPPPPPAPETAAASGSAAAPEAVAQIAAPELPPEAPKATKGAAEKPGKVPHKVEVRDTSMTDNAAKAKDKAPPVKKEEKKTEGGEGEPSFDALLKEAGVSDPKKDTKPKLDKKSLSGGDIKTGMSAVAGKAAGCYQGTQGTATVKLTVAPSGQITKASVTGVFAGTPVAACVVAAVKSTSFPPWDGGPQSFGYSYLLSE
jgi:hypothetical protein